MHQKVDEKKNYWEISIKFFLNKKLTLKLNLLYAQLCFNNCVINDGEI